MPKLQSIDISPSNQQHNLLLDHGKLAYLEKHNATAALSNLIPTETETKKINLRYIFNLTSSKYEYEFKQEIECSLEVIPRSLSQRSFSIWRIEQHLGLYPVCPVFS